MSIVAHEQAPEIPWRPGYRRFTLAGAQHGVSCSASLSIIEPGTGAPMHLHDSLDEVLIVLAGSLEVHIAGERHVVGADHTIAIPAGVPHDFVAIGPEPARIIAFLPAQGLKAATTYLAGGPPASAARR